MYQEVQLDLLIQERPGDCPSVARVVSFLGEIPETSMIPVPLTSRAKIVTFFSGNMRFSLIGNSVSINKKDVLPGIIFCAVMFRLMPSIVKASLSTNFI